MLDEDRLPPGLLKDLGTDRESLRQFVDRFRRDRQAGQNPEAAPKPEERAAAEKPGHVMGAGNEAAQDVAAKDALPTKLEKDSLRSRFEGSDERLSARYREVVNRYYKVLSEEE
jgi:DNA-directed RNA polymerase specialized sigma24 family protein